MGAKQYIAGDRKETIAKLPDKRHVSGTGPMCKPATFDHVSAHHQRLDKTRNLAGVIGPVSIHHNQNFAGSSAVAGIHGSAFPFFMLHHYFDGGEQRVGNLYGIVGGAAVH